MKPLLALVVLSAAGLGVLGCATSGGSLFEDTAATERKQAAEPAPAASSEAVPEEEEDSGEPVQAAEDEEQWEQAYYEEPKSDARKGLRILSDPDLAHVYLDNRYEGTTPLLIEDLPRGRYRLTLMKEGYYPLSAWIAHFSDYSVYNLSLSRIVGFLRVEVEPGHAQVNVGLDSYEPGRVLELPIGRYTVRARAFGYEERSEAIVIRERTLTELALTLPEAPFRVSELRASRSLFSPLNPGALGRVRFSFEVSNHGSGTAVVLDESGEAVHRVAFERFETWNQEVAWDGRDSSGQSVPDGIYTVRLRAVGEREGTVVEREQVVRVDSSLVLAYRSLLSGSAGLLYAPTPEVLPGGSFQLSSLVMVHWEGGAEETLVRVPVVLSTRWGIGTRDREVVSGPAGRGSDPFSRWELDVQAGTIVGYANAMGEESFTLPFFASAALKTALLSPGGAGGFGAALQAKLAYQGVSTDTLANFSGFSVGAPLALRLRAVSLLLEPELILSLSPWRVSYDPEAAEAEPGLYPWAYARAGVLVDLGVLTAGLSASLRTTPFTEGFALDLPFQAALELHWLIPGSSLFLSLVLAGEFSPPQGFYLQGGAGLGGLL